MEFYEFYKKNTSIFLRRDWDQTIQLSDIYSQITRDSLFRFWTCNLQRSILLFTTRLGVGAKLKHVFNPIIA